MTVPKTDCVIIFQIKNRSILKTLIVGIQLTAERQKKSYQEEIITFMSRMTAENLPGVTG